MNHCAIQQSAEMRSPFAFGGERLNPVFCPKPRRLAPVAVAEPSRPLRWHSSHQVDSCDARAGAELDIFLSKEGDHNSPASSNIPFFCGSPPSRPSTNPVIRDARFGENRLPPFGPAHPLPLIDTGSPMSPRKSCARAKFGLAPAAVRVEGFNCLNGDRRGSSSITAVA